MGGKMNDRYSVYCEEEMADLEVNAYYLTINQALKMAKELLNEGKEEVVIVNMENHLKEAV
jgi:phosphopantothenate synthetase